LVCCKFGATFFKGWFVVNLAQPFLKVGWLFLAQPFLKVGWLFKKLI
jgi:hypothetical protein